MVTEPIILDNAKQHSSVSEGVAPSLLKQMGEGVNNVPIVVEPPPTYTMKVRGGVAVDSNGKAAGKGALIQTEKAGCIGAVQDQFLFEPKNE